MKDNTYFPWLAMTQTRWWIDSADPADVARALEHGACGVTLNPLLLQRALYARPEHWNPFLRDIPKTLTGDEKAEAIACAMTKEVARGLLPVFERTDGLDGRICAQVNPNLAHDSAAMIAMAKRLNAIAPNIAVKLPGTLAGLEAMESCVQEGMTIVVTVAFSLSQAIATAERYEKAAQAAEAKGVRVGACYAVIMVGRLDDYLLDARIDGHSAATVADVGLAGTSVAKRVYDVFQERGYRATLLPSGFRQIVQAEYFSGTKTLLSIGPAILDQAAALREPFAERAGEEVDPRIIERLNDMPDFAKAYALDGMHPEEFLGFAPLQRTLANFSYTGWQGLADYSQWTCV